MANLPAIPMDRAQLAKYRVNQAGQEAVRQSFYDFQLYATAGATTFKFFQLPQGQGVTTAAGAVVGNPKTIQDTNMELAGQLPAGQQFLLQGLEVSFFPGSSAAANTYVLQVPSQFAVAAAAAVTAQLDDMMTFYQAGTLRLFIGSKTYLEEGPLMRFPPSTRFASSSAMATNSATVGEVAITNGRAEGEPFAVWPWILLEQSQNFSVSLNFPGAVATPSGFNARVGVTMRGILYRNSQ